MNILLLVAMPVCTNQLHATPTIIFLGIRIGRAEIPVDTRSSSRELNFSTREKKFWKINIPNRKCDLFSEGPMHMDNQLRCQLKDILSWSKRVLEIIVIAKTVN